MILVNNLEVFNFEGAIRGMRNPKNSWHLSDSTYSPLVLGEKDLDLMKRLFKAGKDHRKYLRQIMISVDITAPLYWWKEQETYKVGTTVNSCSTMHKIDAKEIVISDFSVEGMEYSNLVFRGYIDHLEWLRNRYLETKDKQYWEELIKLLPSSYNQKRTVTMNYEVAYNMYFSRKNHKLKEWKELTKIFEEQLPYFKEIMGE